MTRPGPLAILLAGSLVFAAGSGAQSSSPQTASAPATSPAPAASRPPVDPRRNVEEFPAVLARFVRFTIFETWESGACLDELEVYATDEKLGNVALAGAGARASASGSLAGYAIHKVENLNDGLYGNDHSWISDDATNRWAQIDLGRPILINKVVWSRDRKGLLHDRTPQRYRVETALETNQWREVASSQGREFGVAGTLNIAEAPGEEYPDGFVPLSPERAARPKQASDKFLVDTWQADDGLPQNTVLAIAQTRDGYLWLATDDGLVRFDGARFVSFHAGSAPGLPAEAILSLYGDRQGVLWIGTILGRVARLENGAFIPTPVPSQVGGLVFFAEDKSGGLWSSGSGGVCKWDGVRWVCAEPGRREGGRLEADSAGGLWLAQAVGVRGVSPAGKLLPAAAGSEEIRDGRMATRRAGGLWVADVNGGLYALARDGAIHARPQRPVPNASFSLIHEDRAGNLWFGDYGHGLSRVGADGVIERFSSDRGLASNFITALFEDREGNLWAGTGGGGVSRFKRRTIRVFDSQAGLAHPTIHSVCEDRNGDIFFGSAGDGVCRLRAGRVSRLGDEEQLSYVWTLQPGRAGELWAGTAGRGLFDYHWAEPPRYHYCLPGDLLAVFEDAPGKVWAGTHYRGLWSFDGDKETRQTKADGLSDNSVCALAADGNGGLWIGTLEGGLNHLQDGRFRHYGRKEGASSDSIWSLHRDSNGLLWVGTRGGGLNRFDGARFTQYSTANGLPDNVICGILEDGSGNFWMSSFQGVFRVARRELEAVASGAARRVSCAAFGVEDGLNTRECSGGSQPTVCRSRDGRLWFATSKGLAVIDPADVVLNTNPPPVAIEELVLDGKIERAGPAAGHGSAVIPPGVQRLEIHYTALSLTSPQKNRFKYRLKDYDRDWVDAGSGRAAIYTRLPPGRFSFQVIAANNDGVWNESGATLALEALPHFWQTQWFALLAALGAAGLLYRVHSLRVARVERARAAQAGFARQLIVAQEGERRRIASELHDGLTQNLMVIRNQALLALQGGPGSVTARMDQISGSASLAIEEVRAIAANLRPFHLDRLGLTQALEYLIDTVSEAASIEIKAAVDNIDGLFTGEFEINLYRIVQESLNNIWKHSGASDARVKIRRLQKSVRLEVSDDGRGFHPTPADGATDPNTGFGLKGVRERVRIMNGALEIISRPGAGTSLIADIPLP